MSDNTERFLGQIDGKLDSLIENFDKYIVAHSARHEKLDEKVDAHAKDINQAKGAKNAALLVAGALATAVSVLVAAADKIFR